jgi:hypothetical protein
MIDPLWEMALDPKTICVWVFQRANICDFPYWISATSKPSVKSHSIAEPSMDTGDCSRIVQAVR